VYLAGCFLMGTLFVVKKLKFCLKKYQIYYSRISANVILA